MICKKCGTDKDVSMFGKDLGYTKILKICKDCWINERVFSGKDLYRKQNRLKRIYKSIKKRCLNSNGSSYKNYGGMGIKCLWGSYVEFKSDMKDLYDEHVIKYGEKNTQIDRINPRGNYEKENCRWVTIEEQANNKKNTLIINGEPLSLMCRRLGLKYSQIYDRIKRRGLGINEAISLIKYKRI